jgi:H+-translocating NAD(P) transhydrogenase subunit alpha
MESLQHQIEALARQAQDLMSQAEGLQAQLAAAQAAAAAPAQAAGGDTSTALMMMLLFTFTLAIFLGFELISKVPSQLHTPLMSGSNAISGITIVGALIAAGITDKGWVTTVLGTAAVAFATINVVGGYLVTDRMLGMFKTKGGGRS